MSASSAQILSNEKKRRLEKRQRSQDKILAVKISPLGFCCSVPNRCSSFGSNLRVVLCLVCCPWYPRIQPNLSTPAKKTKKAEIDLPPSVLLPLNRFPNRKQINAEKTERYAIHGFGCEIRWGIVVKVTGETTHFLLVSLTCRGW